MDITPSPVQTIDLSTIAAILWDLDGTLVDSEPLHAQAVAQVGRNVGFPVTDAVLKAALGVGYKHCYNTVCAANGMTTAFDDWKLQVEDAFLDLSGSVRPRQNAPDIVRFFQDKNIPQAIVTNSPRRVLEKMVSSFCTQTAITPDIFRILVSSDDVSLPKPSPEGYLLAAQRFAAKPQACLVIEDSPTGLKAGVAAGCQTVFWAHALSHVPTVTPMILTADLWGLLHAL